MKNPYTLDESLFAKPPRPLRKAVEEWLHAQFTISNWSALQWAIVWTGLGFIIGFVACAAIIHKLGITL